MDFLSELPLSFFSDVVDSLVGSFDADLSFFPVPGFSSLSFLLDDVVEASEVVVSIGGTSSPSLYLRKRSVALPRLFPVTSSFT